MNRQTKDSVLYFPCTLERVLTMPCYGGPHDGERRTVTPLSCMGDLVAIWDTAGERCAVYQTVIRFTTRHGDEGTVLRWVP